MVRSATPEPAGGEPTLGDLVSLATRDMSQLIRYELALAKAEFRGDMRRAAIAGALFGITAFFGCLMLFCLCFAYAYLLYWAGAPGGMAGAFGFVTLTLLVLALIAIFLAKALISRVTGMKKTRDSVTEGLGMLRRDGKDDKADKAGKGDKDGNQAKGGELPQGRKGQTAPDGPALGPAAKDTATKDPATKDPAAKDTAKDTVLPDGRRPEIADRSPR